MLRPRIDAAVIAQLDRLTYLLRDVVRSGGRDGWGHLRSHGHHYATILRAVRQGYLKHLYPKSFGYEITQDGKNYLADMDIAAL